MMIALFAYLFRKWSRAVVIVISFFQSPPLPLLAAGYKSLPAPRPSPALQKRDSKENLAILTTTTTTPISSRFAFDDDDHDEHDHDHERATTPNTRRRTIRGKISGLKRFLFPEEEKQRVQDGHGERETDVVDNLKENMIENAALGIVEGVVAETLSFLMHEQLPADFVMDTEHFLAKCMMTELVTSAVSISYKIRRTRAGPGPGPGPGEPQEQDPQQEHDPEQIPVLPGNLPRAKCIISVLQKIVPFLVRSIFHAFPVTIIHLSSEELQQHFFF